MSFFPPAFSPPSVAVCFFLLKYNDRCHRLQGRTQGNDFKHPEIIRKKEISLRTSNNLQHFVETCDLKIADHR